MVETRIAPRHRVMKAGTIEFGAALSIAWCATIDYRSSDARM